MLALNNTWLPSNNTVVTLRYGLTKFIDDNTLSIDFDPATLGFTQTFLSQMQVEKFPQRHASTDYDAFWARIDPTPRNWYSWSANGTMSQAGRPPHAEVRRRLPHDRHRLAVVRGRRGRLPLRPLLHLVEPADQRQRPTPSGNAFASMLLGYPVGRARQPEHASSVSNPFDAFTHYYGAYAQDDLRVSPKLTLNYGLRLEHEDGLREREQRLHRGLRSHAEPRRRARQRRQPAHRPADSRRPGLRRRERRQRLPGRSAGDEVLAARRHGLLVQPEDGGPRRLRHLLGAVELPGVGATNYGQIGFSQADVHHRRASSGPTVSLTNPFPNGVLQPVGNARGALTGVGSADRVHRSGQEARRRSSSTRSTSTASCRATSRSASSTSAPPAATSASAARTTASSTSTRCRSQYLALGAALLEQVPNPFFGLPAGQGFRA